MKFSKYILGGIVAAGSLLASSCVGDLDVKPTDPNIKTEPTEKADIEGYLASLYYDFYTSDGLSVSDGGRTVFTRVHTDLNEITSDEFFISEKWQDPGYQVLNKNIWTDTNEWIYGAFSRENHTCKLASTFISTLHAYGPGFGFTDQEIKEMDAEARALRAYAYYQNIDLFGRGPWIDENSVTGATPPTYDRKQLFEAVVADLTTYVDNLKPASEQVYGRVNRETGYMILAKLYLNAEVYTGTAMYKECADALKNVVASSSNLSLAPEYKYLFCASNSKYVGNGEIFFAFPQSVGTLETWGGTTSLTCATYMEADAADSPLSRQLLMLGFPGTPWSGLRMRPELSKALQGDPRRLVYEGSYQEEIPDLVSYKENSCGYMSVKFTFTDENDYYNSALVAEFDAAKAFNDALEENKDLSADEKDALRKPYPTPVATSQMSPVDFPVFRLADAYLMLAECQLRGVDCNGYFYFNKVRERVGLDPIAAPTASEILHERQCELYQEGYRRSDLIRFNLYTGSSYLWSWKGGEYTGTSIADTRAVFPVPYQYVVTVGQNPGY
ncbi:MAG: RagB/SusD family nutrient uptake outer membrane protein [Muribaculaceae bacterium]|nr:RagB/SusD family nutrient uptake outer membrane protein [Muribaculaceae bacterium]